MPINRTLFALVQIHKVCDQSSVEIWLLAQTAGINVFENIVCCGFYGTLTISKSLHKVTIQGPPFIALDNSSLLVSILNVLN